MTFVEERIRVNPSKVSYDEILHRHRYSYVEKVLDRIGPRSKMLDCACGSGYAGKSLGAKTQYVGVDVSEEAISNARRDYGQYGTYLKIAPGKLPFLDAEFDVVASIETIEHLPKAEHGEFLNELVRVLRPGGFLILSTPNRGYLTKRFLKRRGWTNPYHLYEYATAELRGVLQSRQDLKDLKIRVLGFPIALPVGHLHLSRLPVRVFRAVAKMWILMGQLFPGTSDSIVAVLRKV